MPSTCCDDGLRRSAHRLDEVARHTGECKQPVHVVLALHLDKRADDFVHVAAGTEIAAGTRDHHCLDRARVRQVAEQVPEFRIRLERQWILPLRTVKGDRGHLAVDLPLEMPGTVVVEVEPVGHEGVGCAGHVGMPLVCKG
jgi:hypothetical protein